MFEFNDVQLTQFVGQYLWPLARITAFLLAAPIFGTRVVSTRVRLVLGVVLSFLVAPMLPPLPPFDGLSILNLITTVQQVLIGVTLGFLFQVVFQLFLLAGQYIAMKMGLGFASMNDPANGVSVTVISQFYLLTITVLFVSINGHLAVLELLFNSFLVLPVGTTGLSYQDFYAVANFGSWMFTQALSIALPILAALLIVNIAFGVISRASPQMNIFAVGFPITLILGLVFIWLSFSSFLPLFFNSISEGMVFAENLLL